MCVSLFYRACIPLTQGIRLYVRRSVSKLHSMRQETFNPSLRKLDRYWRSEIEPSVFAIRSGYNYQQQADEHYLKDYR